ncbi:hypothetical protein GCM10029992_02280 [Glycomyces albus]
MRAQGLHGRRGRRVLDVPVDRRDGDRSGGLPVAHGERNGHLGLHARGVDLDAAQLDRSDGPRLGLDLRDRLDLGPGPLTGIVGGLRARLDRALLAEHGRDRGVDLVAVHAVLELESQAGAAVGRGDVVGVADAGDATDQFEKLLLLGHGLLVLGSDRRRGRFDHRLARDLRRPRRGLLGDRR